jgi:hypothetical protein
MEKTITVDVSNHELAELLFSKSDVDVAEIISLWKRKFDENFKDKREKGERVDIFDLNHFFMYVVNHLDEDGRDFFRIAFATIFYKEIDKIVAKNVMYLSK